MSTVTIDHNRPTRLERAGGPDDDAARIVRELHEALHAAVSPYKPPTSEELWERVLRFLPDIVESGVLTDDELDALATILASRLVETRFSERMAETLSDVLPSASKSRERSIGRLTQLSWRYG
jgi:hypothetical protein